MDNKLNYNTLSKDLDTNLSVYYKALEKLAFLELLTMPINSVTMANTFLAYDNAINNFYDSNNLTDKTWFDCQVKAADNRLEILLNGK